MTLQKEGDESGQKAKTIYDDHNGWLIMMVIKIVGRLVVIKTMIHVKRGDEGG